MWVHLQLQSGARIYRRNCRNHLENSICGITYQYHSTLSSERCSWSILFIINPAKKCFMGSKCYCWVDLPFFFFKKKIWCERLNLALRRFYSTSTTHRFSLSHASPFQLSSPTQTNKITKSPFQVNFTISSCCYQKVFIFKSQWSCFTRVLRLQLVQTKPNRSLDAIGN